MSDGRPSSVKRAPEANCRPLSGQMAPSWQDESTYREEIETLRLDGSLILQAIKARRLVGVVEKLQAQCVDESEDTEVRPRSEARGRRAEEHLAADSTSERPPPVGGQGGVTVSYVCPHCHCFPLDYTCWVLTGHGDSCKKSNWSCAACGGQCDWRKLNSVLFIQDGTDRSAKVFRAHAPAHVACDIFMNELELLQKQTGGDSNEEVLVGVLQDGRAAKVQHVGQPRGCKNWRLEVDFGFTQWSPSSPTWTLPEAAVRERADEK